MLLGPLAWGLNLQIGYATVKWACSRNHPSVLTLISAATLAVTCAAAWIGWTCFAKVHHAADDAGGTIIDRSYFMAVMAIALNALLAVEIATSAVSHFILSPCE